MSQAPQQTKNSKTAPLHVTQTTQMTLESRTQNSEVMRGHHIQVSHEFLGGRFDIKG